jgi:hypothetical protein
MKVEVAPTLERLSKGDVVHNRGAYYSHRDHAIERWLKSGAIDDEQASYAYRFANLHAKQLGRWMPSVRWLGDPVGRNLQGLDQIDRLSAADIYTRCIMQMSNRNHALMVGLCVDELNRDGLCRMIKCSASSIRADILDAINDFKKSLDAVLKKCNDR